MLDAKENWDTNDVDQVRKMRLTSILLNVVEEIKRDTKNQHSFGNRGYANFFLGNIDNVKLKIGPAFQLGGNIMRDDSYMMPVYFLNQ